MRKSLLKDRLFRLLKEGRLEEIAELAMVRRRVLGSLVALTFDSDPQVVWRAVEAMGMAVEKMAPSNKPYVKEHARRLYWLITEESGGVFWKAPECLAECAARLPDFLESYVTIAFHLLETLEEEDLQHFRPGALWAIGRLVHLARDDLPTVLPLVLEALDRPDPQTRGMAVWCLGVVGETEALENRPGLLEDQGGVQLYRNRALRNTTVSRLAREVLEGAAHRV